MLALGLRDLKEDLLYKKNLSTTADSISQRRNLQWRSVKNMHLWLKDNSLLVKQMYM